MAAYDFNFRCQFDGANYVILNADLSAGQLNDGEGDTVFQLYQPISAPGLSGMFFYGTFKAIVGMVEVEFVAIGAYDDFQWVFAKVPDGTALDDITAVFPTDTGLAIEGFDFTVCFAAGTRIATPAGERDVETLAIGDLIHTADGRAVPVRWIGRQTRHKLFTRERDFAPVRVRAGALAPGVPHSDLTLTGDHALILGDLAVNAAALVNGTTITFVPMEALPDSVTYFHIETEAHEEIIANGAPAETFVDYVGRRSFDNHREYLDLYGCERIIPEMRRPRISSRRQLPQALAARFGIARFGDDVEADSAALTLRLMAG